MFVPPEQLARFEFDGSQECLGRQDAGWFYLLKGSLGHQ